MDWGHFYLICFAVGFIFSLLSFSLGHLHWHFPHDATHGHVLLHDQIHSGHAGAGHDASSAPDHGAHHASFFNPATIAAFLTWFGATGYLLSRYSTIWFTIGMAIAVCGGLAGASVIYFFLTRVLMSQKENMNASDYEMTGVLGMISVPIREGGTGEIIYSQAGTRRTCGARSDSGLFVPKGSEVVVTRYEKGIAYVRLWTEMSEPNLQEETPSTNPVDITRKETR